MTAILSSQTLNSSRIRPKRWVCLLKGSTKIVKALPLAIHARSRQRRLSSVSLDEEPYSPSLKMATDLCWRRACRVAGVDHRSRSFSDRHSLASLSRYGDRLRHPSHSERLFAYHHRSDFHRTGLLGSGRLRSAAILAIYQGRVASEDMPVSEAKALCVAPNI